RHCDKSWFVKWASDKSFCLNSLKDSFDPSKLKLKIEDTDVVERCPRDITF
ncbi:hypothetical protein R6Q59_010289, partial [Mikania micrantha]